MLVTEDIFFDENLLLKYVKLVVSVGFFVLCVVDKLIFTNALKVSLALILKEVHLLKLFICLYCAL
jgi:hypothetical protein